MNKCGKFCAKIFLHYIDIAIFALGYFILPHPVYAYFSYLSNVCVKYVNTRILFVLLFIL